MSDRRRDRARMTVWLAVVSAAGAAAGEAVVRSVERLVAGPPLADAPLVAGWADSPLVVAGALVAAGILLLLVYVGPGPYGPARLSVLWIVAQLLRAGSERLARAPFSDRPLVPGPGPEWLPLAAGAVGVFGLVALGIWLGAELLRYRPGVVPGANPESRAVYLRFLGALVLPAILGGIVAARLVSPGASVPVGIVAFGLAPFYGSGLSGSHEIAARTDVRVASGRAAFVTVFHLALVATVWWLLGPGR